MTFPLCKHEFSCRNYVGLWDQGTGLDRSDAVINWSDNALNAGGPDKLRIVFTHAATTGNGNSTTPTHGSSYMGYEFMRFAPYNGQHNVSGFPLGFVGIGPVFTDALPPVSRLHINSEENLDTWLQLSNQSVTGQTASDGFRLGVLGATGDALLCQQENKSMVFYTNFGTTVATERMRITHIGSGILNPGGYPVNTTRVSISATGFNSIASPLSLLHIGYNSPINGGYRPWMNIGLFLGEDTDYAYFGLKNEGNDRKDVVIGWGDNTQSNFPDGYGPDYLRFIYTTYSGSLDLGATGANGREVARFEPYGNLGVGNYSVGSIKNPARRLEVLTNLALF